MKPEEIRPGVSVTLDERTAEALQLLLAEPGSGCRWWYDLSAGTALREALAALPVDRWIPVEERLPEDDRPVDGGDADKGDVFEARYYRGRWVGARTWMPRRCTHWRPRPAPPRRSPAVPQDAAPADSPPVSAGQAVPSPTPDSRSARTEAPGEPEPAP